MINNQAKPGYKHTPLGWIPEEWGVGKIKNIAKIAAGATPSTHKAEYWDGDIKWMNSGDLNKKQVYDVTGRITEMGLKHSSTKILPKNCVLIGLAGQGKTRGTVAINRVELCTNQSIAAILPSGNFNEDYVFYNLESRYEELRKISAGDGGRGGLNLSLIGSLSLPLPPLPEQKAIAKVLSTWDEAISKTQELITQKELRKKWLMQQLLTGKKRLKGFKGEWKEKKLGELFTEITAKNDGGRHEIMTISSRHGFVSQNEKFNRVIAGESLNKYTLILKGDFAYNKGNSNSYEMGCIYQLTENQSALVPFVYICFRPTEKVDISFYKHWFLDHGLDKQLKRIITSGARGDGLLNVNSEDFFDLKVIYPPLEEQVAIARILEGTDKEIKFAKQYYKCLLLQKKGLMQVLLSGKNRIKNKI